jgi:hypothetical protein
MDSRQDGEKMDKFCSCPASRSGGAAARRPVAAKYFLLKISLSICEHCFSEMHLNFVYYYTIAAPRRRPILVSREGDCFSGPAGFGPDFEISGLDS